MQKLIFNVGDKVRIRRTTLTGEVVRVICKDMYNVKFDDTKEVLFAFTHELSPAQTKSDQAPTGDV